MTKSLLVNCFLKGTVGKDLLNAIGKFSECSVVSYADIREGYHIESDIDAVIVSGSYARIVKPSDRARFTDVAQLIRTCEVPLLGICFGHQLLCHTYGAKVGSLSTPVRDCFEQVRVIDGDGIFSGFKEGQVIPLAEYHYDCVQKEGLERAGFRLLADSATCEVEAVKHKTKPFIGVQFHPERVKIKKESYPEGNQVIENFYVNIVKR